MTLDEAIKHAEEVAVEMNKSAKAWQKAKDRGNYGWSKSDIENVDSSIITCSECAEEHRQLAEWLRELKQLRKQTGWVPVSKRLPKENEWYQCTVIINDLLMTMDLYYKSGKWLDNRRIDMFNTYDIYGYGNTTEKHKLSYQELISEFNWTKNVVAWKPLSQPYKAERV